jgi:hypothetical protein
MHLLLFIFYFLASKFDILHKIYEVGQRCDCPLYLAEKTKRIVGQESIFRAYMPIINDQKYTVPHLILQNLKFIHSLLMEKGRFSFIIQFMSL